MRRQGVIVVALVVFAFSPGVACGRAPVLTAGLSPGRNLSVYRGLGAWVDAFDYAPAYHREQEGPQLAPDDVAAIASHGVRTLYLQAARQDELSPDGIVDRA